MLSNAKPKIADYPFTTLVPNLGVCELDFRTTVFADIPGAALLCLCSAWAAPSATARLTSSAMLRLLVPTQGRLIFLMLNMGAHVADSACRTMQCAHGLPEIATCLHLSGQRGSQRVACSPYPASMMSKKAAL